MRAYVRTYERTEDMWSRFISGVLAKLFLDRRCRVLDARECVARLTVNPDPVINVMPSNR